MSGQQVDGTKVYTTASPGNLKLEEDSLNTHQSSHHQGERYAKTSHASTSSQLADVVRFITATTFIVTGMVFCILNIVSVIPGPWAAIIGVLFAGIGLIVAFYVLFLHRSRDEYDAQ